MTTDPVTEVLSRAVVGQGIKWPLKLRAHTAVYGCRVQLCTWIDEHERQAGHAVEWRDPFANSCNSRWPAGEANRNIGSQLGDGIHVWNGAPEIAVEQRHHRRRIGRPSAQSRTYGYALAQFNADAARHSGKQGSFRCQIGFIIWDVVRKSASDNQPERLVPGNDHSVAEISKDDQTVYLVETIFTASEYVQREVDLGIRDGFMAHLCRWKAPPRPLQEDLPSA